MCSLCFHLATQVQSSDLVPPLIGQGHLPNTKKVLIQRLKVPKGHHTNLHPLYELSGVQTFCPDKGSNNSAFLFKSLCSNVKQQTYWDLLSSPLTYPPEGKAKNSVGTRQWHQQTEPEPSPHTSGRPESSNAIVSASPGEPNNLTCALCSACENNSCKALLFIKPNGKFSKPSKRFWIWWEPLLGTRVYEQGMWYFVGCPSQDLRVPALSPRVL